MNKLLWVQFEALDSDWHAIPQNQFSDPFSPFTTLCGKDEWSWSDDDSEGDDDFNRCQTCARASTIYQP